MSNVKNLPSVEDAIAAGVKNRSYRTKKGVLVKSYRGMGVTSTLDGRRFVAVGVGVKDDAWFSCTGYIVFHPIVRTKVKLNLKPAGEFDWGSSTLKVMEDQFKNRYAFYEGKKARKKPYLYLPARFKDWYKYTDNGRIRQFKHWGDNPWIGEEGLFVDILKEDLSEEELSLVKYVQEDARPQVEVAT